MLRFSVLQKAHSMAVQLMVKEHLLPLHKRIWKSSASTGSPLLKRFPELSNLSDIIDFYIDGKVSLVCLNASDAVVGVALNQVLNTQKEYLEEFIEPHRPIDGEPEYQAKRAASIRDHSYHCDLFKEFQAKRLFYADHAIILPEYRGNLSVLSGDSLLPLLYAEVEKRFCRRGDLLFGDMYPKNKESLEKFKNGFLAPFGGKIFKITVHFDDLAEIRLCKMIS